METKPKLLLAVLFTIKNTGKEKNAKPYNANHQNNSKQERQVFQENFKDPFLPLLGKAPFI